jgi:hypothetical protein
MAELAKVLLENVGAVIAIIVVLTLAIIAIFKVNLNLDLNDYAKNRKAKHLGRAQHYCAHMEFQIQENGAVYMSWFESPMGTPQWICKVCKVVVNNVDEDQLKREAEYWLKNPKKFKKNQSKYNYHAKRSM